MIKIAVLGYGTVGSGVAEVIWTNQEIINKRVGEELEIKYILDLREFPGTPAEHLIVHDFDQIVNDDEVKIVVEVMGGIEPAYTFVKKSLLAGKSVVTSNKALVAKHGAELLAIAKEGQINFLYEASVGGGIPIIRPLTTSLTGDVIEEITGILNGTTNYMMSKMYHENADYDAVLKEAQAMGYAERDPSADVEGHDACRKIAILSSIISGKLVDFEDIYTEGITNISQTDIQYAKALEMKIKLLASCTRDGDKLCAIVAPHLVSQEHPLYNIEDVFNSIFVKGNMLGDSMFYGSGAGKLPTASAVVGDIVDAAKNPNRSVMATWDAEKLELEDKAETIKKYFVRIKGTVADLKAQLETAFGPITVVTLGDKNDEFGFVTEEMTEGAYEAKAAKFSQIRQMIRVK